MRQCDIRFRIADFKIRIIFNDEERRLYDLLPSFVVFRADDTQPADDDGDLLLTLTVDDGLRPVRGGRLVRNCDTGNGDTLVYALPDGGYQFVIRDIRGRDCCLLQASHDFSRCRCALNGTLTMRSFGLNDALMLVFAFAASRHGALLIHASCVTHGGRAYPFTAKSGTGKSTHAALWMEHIEGTQLLNDDNPIIRADGGEAYAYGSPWSGKTPCYRNMKARLGAVTLIERAPANAIGRLRAAQAFAVMLPACSSMKWDSTIYNNICDTITRVIERVPVYRLQCLPDREAAVICHETIAQRTNG